MRDTHDASRLSFSFDLQWFPDWIVTGPVAFSEHVVHDYRVHDISGIVDELTAAQQLNPECRKILVSDRSIQRRDLFDASIDRGQARGRPSSGKRRITKRDLRNAWLRP
jgi:hypothetical protein